MITLTTRTTLPVHTARHPAGAPLAYAVAVALTSTRVGPAAASIAALAPATVAAVVDLRTGRLPDRLVVLVAAAALAGVLVAGSPGPALVGALVGASGLAGPLLVAHLVSPGAIGFGDVKLAAALGLAVGPAGLRLGLVALCVATATTAAWGLLRRRDALPLGPGLVLGASVALVAARLAA